MKHLPVHIRGENIMPDDQIRIRMRRFLTVAAVAVMVLTAATTAQAAIPAAERQALVDLYNATNGAGWTDNSNWLGTTGTECSWFRVTCDGSQTHVVQLNLYNNNLIGPLPTSLGNLANLQNLFLYSNQLTGQIPPELGSLTNLSHLDLHVNQLTGSIPVQLGNLSNLLALVLYKNQLTGPIPTQIGSLTSLSQLDLSTNQLTGPIPTQIGNMTNLQSLSLYKNQLAGPIPVEMGNLVNLQDFFLDSNQLTGSIPPQLGNLSNLHKMDLRSNQLSGPIPTSLQNLASLNADQSDFRWNALHSADAALIAFLNQKQFGGDWQSTQTIAPAGVAAGSPTTTSLTLSWTPILYTADPGGYRARYGTAPGGPYPNAAPLTPDKSATGTTVTGLTSATTYYFTVESQTAPHTNNQNTVVSEPGPEVTATTMAAPTPTPPPRNPIPATSSGGRIVLSLLLVVAGILMLSRFAR